MYKYFDEIPLGEDIETAYLTWKSEQHRLTPKYEIICSLVPLVKHYFVNVKEDDTIFKITCQHCNGFVTSKGMSVELLYINFLHDGLSTLGIYNEDVDPEIYASRSLPEQKCKVMVITRF